MLVVGLSLLKQGYVDRHFQFMESLLVGEWSANLACPPPDFDVIVSFRFRQYRQ